MDAAGYTAVSNKYRDAVIFAIIGATWTAEVEVRNEKTAYG